jgi:hypothetical protein
MTQPAVTVPAGPTSCARRRLTREGSAYPARRGVHTLHTVSLFRPSPKVAMNPHTTVVLENNNGSLTQLSVEGMPLFRSLLESRHV